ncbi:hypothetical protein ACQY0O_004910 [Thecaphora frezii]
MPSLAQSDAPLSTSSCAILQPPPAITTPNLAPNAQTALLLAPTAFPLRLEAAPPSIWKRSTPEAAAQHSPALVYSLWTTYNDALWLGEAHTSLADFVRHVERLKAVNRPDLSHLVAQLGLMLRTRSAIRQRFDPQAAAALATSILLPTDPPLQSRLDEIYPRGEARSVRAALKGGPAAKVAADLDEAAHAQFDRSGAQQLTPRDAQSVSGMLKHDPDSSLCRWLKAIESRELQLQLLVTLILLKIIAQHSGCIEIAKRRLVQAGADAATPARLSRQASSEEVSSDPLGGGVEVRPKKRSRKPENPKRWDAELDAELQDDHFLWHKKKSSRKGRGEEIMQGDGKESVLETTSSAAIEPEHLNRRLEALVDVLCLDQITASLRSDLGDFLSDLGGDLSIVSQDDAGSLRTQPAAKPVAFGTAARQKDANDALDDVQWLCKAVVEPCFGSALPRQCSLLKGKCFVPSGPGASPTRRSVVKHRSFESQPADQGTKMRRSRSRLSSTTRAPPRPLLRDALEQEEAVGRRSRAGGTTDSQSLLGRGREVSMDRRFARSASAGSAILAAHFGGSQLHDSQNLSVAGADDREAPVRAFITGRTGKRKSEAVRRSDPVGLPTTQTLRGSEPKSAATEPVERQTLVLSTPSKARTVFHRPVSRPINFASQARPAPFGSAIPSSSSSSSVSSSSLSSKMAFRRSESQPSTVGGVDRCAWPPPLLVNGERGTHPLDNRYGLEAASLPSAFSSRSPSPIALRSGSESEGES